MSIKALVEAYFKDRPDDEVMRLLSYALPEIEEFYNLNRELYVTGAKTKQREREIKDRIREMVER